MFKGLIDYLTFGYTFICKGRGKLKPSEMMMIQVYECVPSCSSDSQRRF